MSLNKSVLNSDTIFPTYTGGTPDYQGLLKYLLEPFLDNPESLRIDCELLNNRSRVWIRVAFDGEDKGKAYGRGGRNIQAMRTVLEASAQAVGQSVYLDIFGGEPKAYAGENSTVQKTARNYPPKRTSSGKFSRRPRTNNPRLP